jgi:hypothetical protein
MIRKSFLTKIIYRSYARFSGSNDLPSIILHPIRMPMMLLPVNFLRTQSVRARAELVLNSAKPLKREVEEKDGEKS